MSCWFTCSFLCVLFVFSLGYCLVVCTSAIDCLQGLIASVSYCVSNEMLISQPQYTALFVLSVTSNQSLSTSFVYCRRM